MQIVYREHDRKKRSVDVLVDTLESKISIG